jgi:steroid delta-isomerase-like uncharacterized protein
VKVTTYQQTWIDSLNRGDVSAAERVFAPDCTIHITGGPAQGLGVPEFQQMVGGLLAAFPDLRFNVEDQVVAGDRVTTRWTAEGTHTAPLGGIAPTGKHVKVAGLILDRVVDDRVAERWEQWDQMGMMQQLGLLG